MTGSRTSQRSWSRRCLGAALALVLAASSVAAAVHSHADGQQHRLTCAACTVLHQPRDAAPAVDLPEPPLVHQVALPSPCPVTVPGDDLFPTCLSRAPPA